ncbi:MAG TPA: NUDIX hydrolase [candidate division Zixibacteria bacterium]|nr:NUDIX hydrolase [candidate division Zixibacteria bacterium]
MHFTDPKVGVGVLLFRDGRLLLVKRAMMPEAGKWGIPAGYLDYGEDPVLTATREVLEETGLQIEISDISGVYHNPNAIEQGGASVFILYNAVLVGGNLKAGDDADEAGFFLPEELPELAFESTHDIVNRWRSGEFRSPI